MAYDYPGNVRELRNVLERASLLCDGDIIRAEHLPAEVTHATSGDAKVGSGETAPASTNTSITVPDAGMPTLARIEEEALRERLQAHQWQSQDPRSRTRHQRTHALSQDRNFRTTNDTLSRYGSN